MDHAREGKVRPSHPINPASGSAKTNKVNRYAELFHGMPDGTTQQILVVKVEGDKVVIDTNHPLAGVALNFDIKVLSVREATKEEIEHGIHMMVAIVTSRILEKHVLRDPSWVLSLTT